MEQGLVGGVDGARFIQSKRSQRSGLLARESERVSE